MPLTKFQTESPVAAAFERHIAEVRDRLAPRHAYPASSYVTPSMLRALLRLETGAWFTPEEVALLARIAACTRRSMLHVAELDAWLKSDGPSGPWFVSPYGVPEDRDAPPAAERLRVLGHQATSVPLYSLYWFGEPYRGARDPDAARPLMHAAYANQTFATREARRLARTFDYVLRRVDFVPGGVLGI